VSALSFGHKVGEWFSITLGTRQGDPLSPTTFIIYLERLMDNIQIEGTGISVQGERINNVKFADDIDMMEESSEVLIETVLRLEKAEKDSGLRFNVEKTKTMVFGSEDIKKDIVIEDKTIENVKKFVYLGVC